MAEETEVDRLLVRIKADATLLEQEFAKARQTVKDSSSAMGGDLKEFTDKARNAGDEIVRLKTELLAIAGANTFKDLVVGAFDYTEALLNLSRQTGLTTDMLQTLHAAGIEQGLTVERMDQALRTFTERLGIFASTGSGQAADALRRLGVSTSDPVKAFDQVITKLAQIPDVAERAGLAGQVFGREVGTAMGQVATQGIAGLTQLQQHLASTGALLSTELIQKGAETKDKFEELEFVFKQAFTEGVIDGFVSKFGDFKDAVTSEQFQTAIKNFGTVMGEVANYLVKIGPYLPAVAGAYAGYKIGRFAGPWGGAAGAVIGGLGGNQAFNDNGNPTLGDYLWPSDDEDNRTPAQTDEDSNGVTARSQGYVARMLGYKNVGITPATETFGQGGNGGHDITNPPTPPEVNPDDKLIADLAERVKLQGLINDGKAREAAVEQALSLLSDKATKAQRQRVMALAGEMYDEKATAAQKKALDDANRSIDQQVNKLEQSTAALAESDEQKFVDQQLLQAENTLIQKGVTDLDAKKAALDRVRQAATEAYGTQQQQSRANQVTNMERQAYENLGNSIVEAASKGKLSLKSLGDIGLQVAQELEQAFLKLAIINPLENAMFGGSPGYQNMPTLSDFGGSVLGKIFGGGGDEIEDIKVTGVKGALTDMGSESCLSQLGSWFGGFFAEGGPVSPSKAYMVGENGPELFVPHVAGQIVPRGSGGGRSSGMGGRPPVILNVQARDAQSFLRSEAQLAAMMTRALYRGRRNL